MLFSAKNKLDRLNEEIDFLKKKREEIDSPQQLVFREPGYAIQKSLEVAIEAALDISRQLLATHKISQPQENREVFAKLAENELISFENIDKYKKMASFRNILVHEYISVDNNEIFQVLHKLEDLESLSTELAIALKNITP